MRTFLLILLAFVAGVAVLVALFAWQGRAAREYGRAAAQAAQRVVLSAPQTPCAALLRREPPATVQSCVVRLEAGQPSATLTLEGGRAFRIGP